MLRTAMRIFAEDGLEVPLSRIAQRAGVGAGTVYRHFPSKEILLEAVLATHVHDLADAAERRAASAGAHRNASAGDALLAFLLEAIEKTSGRVRVCDALTADNSWPRADLAGATQHFRHALEQLLHKAKRSGTVRADIQPDDLTALISGGAALRSAHHSRARGTRLVRLLLDGLLTKDAGFRDNTGRARHETGYCRECGARLRLRDTGRPPAYCGATCRQRARRRRITAVT
ncbi:TetR/AcrR family transcriptional regulator [Dactylosporangium sp. NPDC051541]|uniref:TetR/AcrR family transcriptional regulator n=1 Tax=Dactylosporangium sp. NPDC051541 TaxID=3363977 RepID=UPI0037A83033